MISRSHGVPSRGAQGRVIEDIGDGAMCVFPTADAAAGAAGEMQSPVPEPGRRQSKTDEPHRLPLGKVIGQNADVFGDAVNLAARMSGIALPVES